MQTTYIFGHRNPDTDSICSSIALSYLKNSLGEKTQARAIGHLNNETKFVLDYFGVDEPQYLNDVRVRIKNIKYDKKAAINEKESIFDAYQMMQEQHITAVPIVNNEKKLIGFVTMKDLAKYLINIDSTDINTTMENLLDTIDATVVTKFSDSVNGAVMTVGIQSATFKDEIELTHHDILITGDRYRVIKYAIMSHVEMIILPLDSEINPELIDLANQEKVTIIRSHMSSFKIANRIGLSNYITSINTTPKPYVVYDDEFYGDFQNLVHKLNHTNYPVVNHKDECLGMISLSWPNDYQKQKIILVDHNTFTQSVEGIEEAEIVEIIDHHNLGAIGTMVPINFRSMPVGCTSTIIYKMFLDHKVTIPRKIAGLLLSAILSDTLLLTSPTTTEYDKNAVNNLAKTARVDIKKYGYDMIKASSSIKGLTVQQQVYQDFKSYNVGSTQIGLGQLLTLDFDEINNNMQEYVDKLESICATSTYSVVALFITDVIRNGSYIIYNKDAQNLISESFCLDKVYEGVFVNGLVSRKKQMLPAMMEILEK
jgi:manganese-dependent inorganic pyrophosphatase